MRQWAKESVSKAELEFQQHPKLIGGYKSNQRNEASQRHTTKNLQERESNRYHCARWRARAYRTLGYPSPSCLPGMPTVRRDFLLSFWSSPWSPWKRLDKKWKNLVSVGVFHLPTKNEKETKSIASDDNEKTNYI